MKTPIQFGEKECLRVEKLREKLIDLDLDSQWISTKNLIRWLKANDMKVRDAEKKIRECIIWRKINYIDTILDNWEPHELLRKLKPEICGYINNCMPVVISTAEFITPSIFLELEEIFRQDEEEYRKYAIWCLERVLDDAKKQCINGTRFHQVIVISDFSGFPLSKFIFNPNYIRFSMKLGAELANSYPDVLHKLFVVNPPAIIHLAYSMFKHLVPQMILDTLEILGSDVGNHLSKCVPRDILPTKYGGSNKEFEQTAYKHWKVVETEQENLEDEFKVKVAPGHKLEFPIEVVEFGTSIRWKFKTINYDIAFCVRTPQDTTAKARRLSSQKELQTGELVCKTSGKYMLVFDNSYSKIRSKTLYLSVMLVLPTTMVNMSCCN